MEINRVFVANEYGKDRPERTETNIDCVIFSVDFGNFVLPISDDN